MREEVEKTKYSDVAMLRLNDVLDIKVEMLSRCLSSPRQNERIIRFGDIDLKVINTWMLSEAMGVNEVILEKNLGTEVEGA